MSEAPYGEQSDARSASMSSTRRMNAPPCWRA